MFTSKNNNKKVYILLETRVPTAGVFSRDLGFFGTELGFWGFCLRNWVFFSKFQTPKSGRKLHQLPPPPRRIHEFTEPHRLPPRRNRAENSINYPPFEFTEPHRLPPCRNEIGPKTPSTTPPRIHGTSSTTPLEIGPKTPSTTPPSNSWNLIDYPPPSKSGQIR